MSHSIANFRERPASGQRVRDERMAFVVNRQRGQAFGPVKVGETAKEVG